MARHRVLRIGILCFLISLFLVACGRSQTATPDAVHREWIAALQSNDRQAALSLVTDELRPAVDRALGDMQTELHSPALGTLQSLDIQPLIAQGAGQLGWSRWVFAQHTECFTATLAQVEGAWKVANWGRRACEER